MVKYLFPPGKLNGFFHRVLVCWVISCLLKVRRGNLLCTVCIRETINPFSASCIFEFSQPEPIEQI